MQLDFNVDDNLNTNIIKIITHSENKKNWSHIKKVISSFDEEIILIDAKKDSKVPIKYKDIVSIESEGRMCNVRLRNGQMLLLGIRLKKFDETKSIKHFIKINNGVMINIQYIESFRSSDNARIEVLMKDASVYFVNRYYIKNFKENLL